MEKKYVITLKEAIRGSNLEKDLTYIFCDRIIYDQLVPSGLIEYFIDGEVFALPVHNFLGYSINFNYKPE